MRIKTKAGMIAGNLGGASVWVKTALEAGILRTPHADIGGWGGKWEVRHAELIGKDSIDALCSRGGRTSDEETNEVQAVGNVAGFQFDTVFAELLVDIKIPKL